MITNVLEYLEQAVSYETQYALADENEVITYRQLLDASQKVGTYILERGEWKNQPIAVLIDRNVLSIILFLGIVYSGNFYVPIDPTMPEHRIELIMNTLKPVMVMSAVEEKYSKGHEVILKADWIFSSNMVNWFSFL